MATVLHRDITDTLRRLRAARAAGDTRTETHCESRLNWLLDQIDAGRDFAKSDY